MMFTPVSHLLLPRSDVGQGHPHGTALQRPVAKQFYLFGHPIAHPMSPHLHNTGFEKLGLPCKYEIFETPTVTDDVKAALHADDFGSASVMILLGLDMVPLLHEVLPEAKAIGAVNTIIPRKRADGSMYLFGTNTDWRAIRDLARAALFALNSLGIETIYSFNRRERRCSL